MQDLELSVETFQEILNAAKNWSDLINQNLRCPSCNEIIALNRSEVK